MRIYLNFKISLNANSKGLPVAIEEFHYLVPSYIDESAPRYKMNNKSIVIDNSYTKEG